jgi:deoxyhypusine synthase
MSTQLDASTSTQHGAVLAPSQPVPESSIPVKGPDFDQPQSLHSLLDSYSRIGFQATSFGKACEIVDEMVRIHSNLSYQSLVLVLTYALSSFRLESMASGPSLPLVFLRTAPLRR